MPRESRGERILANIRSVEGEGAGSSGDEEEVKEEDEEGDVTMSVDGDAAPPKASADPSDLSAFKMNEYDDEESKGVGESSFASCATTSSPVPGASRKVPAKLF